MKRIISVLILVFVTTGLLTGCPYRPRHGGAPKPRMPYVENQTPVPIAHAEDTEIAEPV